MKELIDASAKRVVEMNQAFDKRELCGFEAGGHFAPENIQMYRKCVVIAAAFAELHSSSAVVVGVMFAIVVVVLLAPHFAGLFRFLFCKK